MSQQSRTWQRKVLADRRNHDDLFWYPEAKMPVAQRRNPLDDGYTPVGYPGRYIPVVPVGANPEASRRITEMLCWLFYLCIPNVQEVTAVLTDAKALADTKAAFYDWTTQDVMLDVTCAHCGGIERVAHTIAEEAGSWLCAECIDSQRWHEAYRDGAL